MRSFPPLRRRARGAALITSLFILLAVLIVGVAAVRAALRAELAARNERDRHIALQCAEAALSDAERDIEGGANPASDRAALFATGNALGFVDGCGSSGASLGLCLRTPPPGASAWERAALASKVPEAVVSYGQFTGTVMPTGTGTLPLRAPRYVIELMPYAHAGEDASRRAANFYRITAIGFGAREHTSVVLQSFYRKATPLHGAP
jgi:Tfp pilus assembly protein PilX